MTRVMGDVSGDSLHRALLILDRVVFMTWVLQVKPNSVILSQTSETTVDPVFPAIFASRSTKYPSRLCLPDLCLAKVLLSLTFLFILELWLKVSAEIPLECRLLTLNRLIRYLRNLINLLALRHAPEYQRRHFPPSPILAFISQLFIAL